MTNPILATTMFLYEMASKDKLTDMFGEGGADEEEEQHAKWDEEEAQIERAREESL